MSVACSIAIPTASGTRLLPFRMAPSSGRSTTWIAENLTQSLAMVLWGIVSDVRRFCGRLLLRSWREPVGNNRRDQSYFIALWPKSTVRRQII